LLKNNGNLVNTDFLFSYLQHNKGENKGEKVIKYDENNEQK